MTRARWQRGAPSLTSDHIARRITPAETLLLSGSGRAPQGMELRHLRYFVAVADAGTFTHAAERMYIAQPTLSQQIRQLEKLVGTPLLRRLREGVRLTEAGVVLLEESRTILSLIDHGVCRTRQAAGIGRPRLRFVVPPAGDAFPAPLEAMSLTATAGLVWNGDLSRPLQQVLVDAAELVSR